MAIPGVGELLGGSSSQLGGVNSADGTGGDKKAALEAVKEKREAAEFEAFVAKQTAWIKALEFAAQNSA